MAKFKVGDKVRVKADAGGIGFTPEMSEFVGKVCTVKEVAQIPNFNYTLVEATCTFLSGGHWWWREDWLEPVKNTTKKLIVTTDGETTTAKLIDGKQTIKTATAKCSKDDEFCFETGAQIAVDRLLGKKPAEPEKPKFTKADLKNGMFGFIDNPVIGGRRDWFIIADDRLVYDDGGFDWLRDVHADLSLGLLGLGKRISFIVDGAKSFDCAKDAWKTHDNAFGTILYERK